jgi:hypothetical protein
MRSTILAIAASLALVVAPNFAHAQNPGIYNYGNWISPSPYSTPYPYSYSSVYGAPGSYYYGRYNTYVTPAPWGSTVYRSYYNRARPLYSGPMHSVYFDPITGTYRYDTGYLNSPYYRYYYRY